ncbi:hypothetical protein MnTg03_01306 [bacterium MnTg03]|nr:hypothetical protein MnTg03_01306 [bacterium MnTg03]
MNNFDEWSQIISRFLKAEADLLTSVAKHDIEADSPRSAFIRSVLELFLPSSYAIGSGRIIDSSGNSSDSINIVIYRRDFPRLNLPGSADVFIYESVLATIEVRTKLVRKTLFQALDTCVSVAELKSGMSPEVLKNIAAHNKLTLNDQNKYVHKHPLLTDRFNLIGRPPSFIYGFNGFKTSPGQLNDNISIWLERRQNDGLDIDLKSFPAVVATQGCVGWRNAAPLSANSNHLFGIGADAAPIRLIVLQLLYQLNRRLKVTPDGYGLKPGVDAYLDQMAPPDILYTLGKATHDGGSAPKAEKTKSKDVKAKAPGVAKSQISKSQPAAKTKPAPLPKPVAKSKPVPKPKPVTETKPALELEPVTESKPAPEPKAATAEPKEAEKPGADADSTPASDSDSAFDFDAVFETMPVANHVPDAELEEASTPAASKIPKPTLGANYHEEQTRSGMPIPDAGLVTEAKPEPEPKQAVSEPSPKSTKIEAEIKPKPDLEFVLEAGPEAASDPFIETMRISVSDSNPESGASTEPKPSSKPTPGVMYNADPTLSMMPAVENKSDPEPQIETAKTKTQKPELELESDSDSKPDPYLETTRIPELASKIKKSPFDKTMPGLQDPPKSIH